MILLLQGCAFQRSFSGYQPLHHWLSSTFRKQSKTALKLPPSLILYTIISGTYLDADAIILFHGRFRN